MINSIEIKFAIDGRYIVSWYEGGRDMFITCEKEELNDIVEKIKQRT